MMNFFKGRNDTAEAPAETLQAPEPTVYEQAEQRKAEAYEAWQEARAKESKIDTELSQVRAQIEEAGSDVDAIEQLKIREAALLTAGPVAVRESGKAEREYHAESQRLTAAAYEVDRLHHRARQLREWVTPQRWKLQQMREELETTERNVVQAEQDITRTDELLQKHAGDRLDEILAHARAR